MYSWYFRVTKRIVTCLNADLKRDIVRKIILKLISNGCTRYTDIRDDATMKCLNVASSNTVKRQFYKYLVAQGYVERIKLGKYRLTKKGEMLLTIL